MSTMRELKNHINSIKTTEQLADAMKSISTAKYYRISSVSSTFIPYAERCADMLGSLEDPFTGRKASGKKCFVVLTGNRGLCGGYNTEIMSFFESIIEKEKNPFIVVCGKWGIEYFREKGLKSDRQFVFKDVPAFAEGASLAVYLTELYSSGRADEIIIVYQKFKNILMQIPTSSKYLPVKTEGEGSNAEIYYPDKESVEKELYGLCLKNRAYSFLLEWASSVQSATMMAMRNASDNASELNADLGLQLNRKRQSQVTSGVIEISSSNESQ